MTGHPDVFAAALRIEEAAEAKFYKPAVTFGFGSYQRKGCYISLTSDYHPTGCYSDHPDFDTAVAEVLAKIAEAPNPQTARIEKLERQLAEARREAGMREAAE